MLNMIGQSDVLYIPYNHNEMPELTLFLLMMRMANIYPSFYCSCDLDHLIDPLNHAFFIILTVICNYHQLYIVVVVCNAQLVILRILIHVCNTDMLPKLFCSSAKGFRQTSA